MTTIPISGRSWTTQPPSAGGTGFRSSAPSVRCRFVLVAEGRIVLGEVLDLLLDHLALAREELRDGAAKALVRDVMRAVGRHRQVAALEFMRPLGAGLDAFQPVIDRELDRPIIAALEMQHL